MKNLRYLEIKNYNFFTYWKNLKQVDRLFIEVGLNLFENLNEFRYGPILSGNYIYKE